MSIGENIGIKPTEQTEESQQEDARLSADQLSRNNFLFDLQEQVYKLKLSGAEIVGISFDDFERLVDIALDDVEIAELQGELESKNSQILSLQGLLEAAESRRIKESNEHYEFLSKIRNSASGQIVGLTKKEIG